MPRTKLAALGRYLYHLLNPGMGCVHPFIRRKTKQVQLIDVATLPRPASSAATQVGWTFLSDAQRTRTSIPPTRAHKSQAQTPESIPKPHRPRHSKPRQSLPNAGPSRRKRKFWAKRRGHPAFRPQRRVSQLSTRRNQVGRIKNARFRVQASLAAPCHRLTLRD